MCISQEGGHHCINLFAVLDYSALERIIVSGYKALSLIYFFTTGKDEVKAWTIQVGAFSCQWP